MACGDAVTDDEGTLVSEVRGFFAEPTADGTFFDSPYEYDLVWFQRGRFLTNFSRTAKQSELATVVNKSYGVVPETQQGYMHNFGFPPEGGGALSAPIRFSILVSQVGWRPRRGAASRRARHDVRARLRKDGHEFGDD